MFWFKSLCYMLHAFDHLFICSLSVIISALWSILSVHFWFHCVFFGTISLFWNFRFDGTITSYWLLERLNSSSFFCLRIICQFLFIFRMKLLSSLIWYCKISLFLQILQGSRTTCWLARLWLFFGFVEPGLHVCWNGESFN